jgi:hypothetical protein
LSRTAIWWRVFDLNQIGAARESGTFLASPFRGIYAMRDGFPHSIAVGLGLTLAFALSLFVFAAWGGLLH